MILSPFKPHVLEPFPDKEKFEFKPEFVHKYSALTDFKKFQEYSLSFLPKSVRINTMKATIDEVKSILEKSWYLTPIPWCPEGFWIRHKEGRRDIGNTLEHCLGLIYVQEAASMIPAIVLDPKPGDVVLDIAAAPGSKTTQMAAMMNNQGLIVANDIKGDRLAALGVNLTRCGVLNTIVTQMIGQAMRGLSFDKILIDAPCSGSGTIRKSPKTLLMWNQKSLATLAKNQLSLLNNAWPMLVRGGTLVYSTCSNDPEENEEVITKFLDSHSTARVDDIKLPLQASPLPEVMNSWVNPNVKKALRLWPQDNDTEGFFVAKFVKEE